MAAKLESNDQKAQLRARIDSEIKEIYEAWHPIISLDDRAIHSNSGSGIKSVMALGEEVLPHADKQVIYDACRSLGHKLLEHLKGAQRAQDTLEGMKWGRVVGTPDDERRIVNVTKLEAKALEEKTKPLDIVAEKIISVTCQLRLVEERIAALAVLADGNEHGWRDCKVHMSVIDNLRSNGLITSGHDGWIAYNSLHITPAGISNLTWMQVRKAKLVPRLRRDVAEFLEEEKRFTYEPPAPMIRLERTSDISVTVG